MKNGVCNRHVFTSYTAFFLLTPPPVAVVKRTAASGRPRLDNWTPPPHVLPWENGPFWTPVPVIQVGPTTAHPPVPIFLRHPVQQKVIQSAIVGGFDPPPTPPAPLPPLFDWSGHTEMTQGQAWEGVLQALEPFQPE